MKLVKVDLLDAEPAGRPAKDGKRPSGFFVSKILIVLLFAGSFAVGRLSMSQTNPFTEQVMAGIPILRQVRFLISSPDRQLKGESEDRINILLLGMGGEGHEGPNLTDTVMVASIRPSDNHVALLSIPRDLLVPVPDRGWQKINAINVFAEKDHPGRGGEITRQAVENLLGFDIPYYVRVDFEGFKDIIDAVDGVDVYVERSFADHTYPTSNFGVTTVSFQEGWQTMDGRTALVYARSRHGTNGEGNDFARAKRQQKTLTALKDKMLSADTYLNPSTIANTLSSLRSNVSTNLQIGEIVRLARMAGEIDRENVVQRVIDNGPDSPLTDSVYGGAYVLVPKKEDWSELRAAAMNVFDTGTAAAPEPPKPTETAKAAAERAGVEIRNGSGISGVARTLATAVTSAELDVVRIGNADSFDHDRTLIYDLTKGKKKDALARLTKAVGTNTVRLGTLEGVAANVDFVVIIGKDIES